MILFLLLHCLPQEDVEKKVIGALNEFRKTAGLGPVTLDATLSKGCKAHAEYLVKNDGHPSTEGVGAHEESSKLPGFTNEGQRAGKSSNIINVDPEQAVDYWMATPFHRIPLLDPGLRKVGFGHAKGGKDGYVSVMDVRNGGSGGKWPEVLLYPVDKQKGVPYNMPYETPNPVPPGKDRKVGYPVTAIFPPGTAVKGVSASLKNDSANDLEFYLSSPDKPADRKFQQNAIILIPVKFLEKGKTYTVTLAATVNGRAWKKTWSFTAAE